MLPGGAADIRRNRSTRLQQGRICAHADQGRSCVLERAASGHRDEEGGAEQTVYKQRKQSAGEVRCHQTQEMERLQGSSHSQMSERSWTCLSWQAVRQGLNTGCPL